VPRRASKPKPGTGFRSCPKAVPLPCVAQTPQASAGQKPGPDRLPAGSAKLVGAEHTESLAYKFLNSAHFSSVEADQTMTDISSENKGSHLSAL